MKNLTKITIIIVFMTAQVFSQKYLERQFEGYDPDELVTLSPNLTFNQAVALLSKVSETMTGKKIVSTVEINEPISLDVVNMPYDKALVLLTQMAGLGYEEREDVVVIKRKNETIKEVNPEKYADINSREVKISAVFFEMDVNEAKQRGIDWKFLLSRNNLDIGGKLGVEEAEDGGSTQNQTPEFGISTDAKWDFGGFFGQATAMFKFFENEQLGEIIASPNVTVRDGQKGRIQVGSDFSIKQKDFAGNVIENFFSTGSIIEVIPYVYNEEGLDYVLLDVKVERSSFIPDQLTTEIRKTEASTQVLMFNGEETVIGGLFINDETVIRNGIPFLKDLPWWVFGIRYLTGSDETRINKKELVILLKAELAPTLRERVTSRKSTTPIKDEVNRFRENVRYYQFNQTK